jgi:Domain of unknown function (DUF1772)
MVGSSRLDDAGVETVATQHGGSIAAPPHVVKPGPSRRRGHGRIIRLMLFELVALLGAGIFAGAAVYVSLVEHPARVEAGSTLAIAEFRPSYRRAAVMQAALAAVGGLAGVGAWVQGGRAVPLVAGLVLSGVIPFTLLVIMPTNKRLLDPALPPASAEATALLGRWGRLHAVRSLAGTLAFLLLALHVGRLR